MPTRAELEQALKNADAAGDTEAAQILAQELGRMSGQTVQPASFGRGGIVPGPAGDPARQANVQFAEAITPGIAEGGRQLAGGLKQISGGLSDFFDAFVHGKPYRGPDVRLPDNTIIRGSDLETSRHNQETANELLRQVQQRQDWIEKGIDYKIAGNVAAATELASLAAAPELVGPKAVTMGGAAVRNMLTSTASTALQFDADASKQDDVLMAMAAGPILGFAPAIIPATKNYLGRALNTAASNPRVVAAIKSAKRTLGRTRFTLAQETQVPALIDLERASYNSEIVEFHAQQGDDFLLDTVEALSRNIPAGANARLGNEFVATRKALEGGLKAMQKNASVAFEDGMAEASRLASRVQTPQGPAPGPRAPETFNQGVPARPDNVVDIRTARNRGPAPTGARVPVNNFASQAKATFAQAREAQAAGGRPIGAPWMKQMEQQLSKGYLTVQETEAALRQLTALQKKDGPAKALGYKLRDALERDLDLLEQSAGAATDDAIRTVIETRKAYRQAKDDINALQNLSAYKLLGVKSDGNLDMDSNALLGAFKTRHPEVQTEIRNFLRETNPELLNSLRARAINEAAESAQGPLQAAAEGKVSLTALDDALFDTQKGVFRTAGLWDKAEGEALNDIRDGLRVVMASKPSFRGAGTQIKSEDVAINLVSQNPGFVTRQAVRFLMSRNASKMFTDPQVRATLMKIRRSTTGTPTNLTARAALLSYLQDNCDESCYE